MYSKIIVGYDGSDQAKDALALGTLLAEIAGAELVVAGVFQFAPMWGGIDPAIRDAEIAFARQVEQAAKEAGATAELMPSTSPARGLQELAEEINADLIVVGSSRHGRLGQTLVGNVGVALLHGSPCAVAVAPSGYRDQADRGIAAVVVGFDGSAESRLALEAGCELARARGATLKLVSVAKPPPTLVGKGGPDEGWRALKAEIERQARAQLEEARDSVPDDVAVEPTLVVGDPAEGLADAAAAPGSIVVLGSRGYGPLRRVLLGSVSRALARSAPAPLVVHPRSAHDEPRTVERAQAQKVS